MYTYCLYSQYIVGISHEGGARGKVILALLETWKHDRLQEKMIDQ